MIRLAGARTLFYKEVLRFWKVGFQTVAAPVLTAMMYLLIFGHVMQGRVEVFPGVRSVPLHGHTPGHSGYMIASGDKSLLIWGDIIHVPEVQVARPEVTMVFDTDPHAAAVTRKHAPALTFRVAGPGSGGPAASGGRR